jgi:hypothetical protein
MNRRGSATSLVLLRVRHGGEKVERVLEQKHADVQKMFQTWI